MKSNIKTKIQRAKRTALGRTFCRLAGDRTGAVLMEYVILGVMVAAAVTATVIYFGDTIRNQFVAMSQAGAGETVKAKDASDKAKTAADTADSKGKEAASKHSDIGGRD